MNYHIMINAHAKEVQCQIKELYTFVSIYCKNMEQGETYIFAPESFDVSAYSIGNCVVIQSEYYQPEQILNALSNSANEDMYIFGSDTYGAELSVRLAKRLGGSSLTAVQEVCYINEEVFAKKMVYSNHMQGTFRLKQYPYCISLAKGLSQEWMPQQQTIIQETRICTPVTHVIKRTEQLLEQTGGLSEASMIVAAGRGIKNKENIALLEQIAKIFDAQVGVSRPVAMNAWAPMQQLIGVSGSMTRPEICIAVGVSGAAAFYAGIEKSKCIIAINTDDTAPIFKKSDVGIVADFAPVLQTVLTLAQQQRAEE